MPALEKKLLDTCFKKINKSFMDFPTFIESGSFYGHTTYLASQLFETVHSIEIHEGLYSNVANRFTNIENTTIHLGDTLDILPKILNFESKNTVFWLDGHNSGPGTSVGKIDFPALQECEIIDSVFFGEYGLVLIDDIRMLGQTHKHQIDDSLLTLTPQKLLNAFKNKKILNYWFESSELDENDRLVIYITSKKI